MKLPTCEGSGGVIYLGQCKHRPCQDQGEHKTGVVGRCLYDGCLDGILLTNVITLLGSAVIPMWEYLQPCVSRNDTRSNGDSQVECKAPPFIGSCVRKHDAGLVWTHHTHLWLLLLLNLTDVFRPWPTFPVSLFQVGKFLLPCQL